VIATMTIYSGKSLDHLCRENGNIYSPSWRIIPNMGAPFTLSKLFQHNHEAIKCEK